jgi:ABC-2 type transport system permease protein
MNTPSNAMPESVDMPRVAPMGVSPTRPLYWSIRRELWENRAVYIGPLAAAGVFLFGFVISLIHLPARMRGVLALDPAEQRHSIMMPYDLAAALLMVTAIVITVFYCLDALYGERRDRSILFWKSLPVSDTTTVLSKASIPFVILPLLAFAVTVVLQFIMLLLSSAVLVASGISISTIWSDLSFSSMWPLLLYHLVTVHVLGPAPFYAWLLLVSAWARRAPFLWAALPPVAIIALEKLLFHTSHFAMMLGSQFTGGGMEAMTGPNSFPTDPGTHVTPLRLISSPGMWIGLVLTAAFLFAAIRLRRYRGPI